MEVRRLKPDELQHHGVKGQKWGVRRYQNPDGSYTAEGKARLDNYRNTEINYVKKRLDNLSGTYNKRDAKLKNKVDKFRETGNEKQAQRVEKTRESYKKMYESGKSKCEKEIEVLKNYSLSDFERESHNVSKLKGKAATKTALDTLGGMAFGAITGVSVVSVHAVDTQKYKTDLRLNKGKSSIQTVEAKALKESYLKAKNPSTKARLKAKYEEQIRKDKEEFG